MKPGDRICKCGRFQSECICVQKINTGSQEGEKTYSKREVKKLLLMFGLEIIGQAINNTIGEFDQEKWIEENL